MSYAALRQLGQDVEPTLAALNAVTYLQLGVRWYTKDVASLIRQRLKGVKAEPWSGAPGRYAVLFRGKPHYGTETSDAADLVYLAEGKGQFVWADANCVWPTTDGILEIRPFPMPEALVSALGAHLPPPDILSTWTPGSGLAPSTPSAPNTGYEQPATSPAPQTTPAAQPAATPGGVPGASWWQQQPDSTKVLIIGGAAVGGLAVVAVLLGQVRDKRTPNVSRRTARRHEIGEMATELKIYGYGPGWVKSLVRDGIGLPELRALLRGGRWSPGDRRYDRYITSRARCPG